MQDYLLKDKEEKVEVVTETVEKNAEKDAVDTAPKTPVTENVVESSATEAVNETVPESVDATAEENVVATDDSDKAVTEAPAADSEESDENADEGNTADETPEIKVSFIYFISYPLNLDDLRNKIFSSLLMYIYIIWWDIYFGNSWKQHLEITVFQLQIKADTVLPVMLSTIGKLSNQLFYFIFFCRSFSSIYSFLFMVIISGV